MNHQSVSLLQETLEIHRHLDLSHDIVKEIAVWIASRKFSDVFQSRLSKSWQPRLDPNIIRLLKLENAKRMSTPEPRDPQMAESSLAVTSTTVDGVTVAVNQLRIWGEPDDRIIKVGISPYHIKSLINHYDRRFAKNSSYGQVYRIQTLCRF